MYVPVIPVLAETLDDQVASFQMLSTQCCYFR